MGTETRVTSESKNDRSSSCLFKILSISYDLFRDDGFTHNIEKISNILSLNVSSLMNFFLESFKYLLATHANESYFAE